MPPKRSGRPRIHPVCSTLGCRGSLDTEKRKKAGRCNTPACKLLVAAAEASTTRALPHSTNGDLPTFVNFSTETRRRPRDICVCTLWHTRANGQLHVYTRSVTRKVVGYGAVFLPPTRVMPARQAAKVQLAMYAAGYRPHSEAPRQATPVQEHAVVLIQRWVRRLRRVQTMLRVAQLVAAVPGVSAAFWAPFPAVVGAAHQRWHRAMAAGTFANPQYDDQTKFDRWSGECQMQSGEVISMHTVRAISTATSSLARQWNNTSPSGQRQQLVAYPVTHYYATDAHDFPPHVDLSCALTRNAVSLQTPGAADTREYIPALAALLATAEFHQFYPSFERLGLQRQTVVRFNCIVMTGDLVVPLHARLLAMVQVGATFHHAGVKHTVRHVRGSRVSVAPPATASGQYTLKTKRTVNGVCTFTGGTMDRFLGMITVNAGL